MSNVNDNREFWRTVKPFLTDKGTNHSTINLIDDNGGIITSETKLTETFSNHFEKVTLSTTVNENISGVTPKSLDRIDKIIEKFDNHESVLMIRNIFKSNSFEFSPIDESEVLEQISNLDSKKNGTHNNIPVKSLKNSKDAYSKTLTNIWNIEIVQNKKFDDNLKLADVTPVL